MKKNLTILMVVLLLAVTLSLFGCSKNEDEVVIKIANSYEIGEDGVLMDYMEHLKDSGKLEFEVKDGMIISLNGKKNTLNSYWMIYTDDDNYSNESWGTYEYKGSVLGSATQGVTTLPISKDATYILVYQTF